MNGDEEMGEYLFGIGDVSSFLLRVRRDCERRKDQMSKMRCHFYSAGGLGHLHEIIGHTESNEVRIPSTLVSVMALLGEVEAACASFIL